jgi:hypothetical protein
MQAMNYLYATARNASNAIFNPPLAAEGIEPEAPSKPKDDGLFSPKADDVVEVKKLFLEHFKFPLELIDSIIDLAEYWPHTTSVFHRPRKENGAENALYVRAGDPSENQLIVSIPKVIF